MIKLNVEILIFGQKLIHIIRHNILLAKLSQYLISKVD